MAPLQRTALAKQRPTDTTVVDFPIHGQEPTARFLSWLPAASSALHHRRCRVHCSRCPATPQFPVFRSGDAFRSALFNSHSKFPPQAFVHCRVPRASELPVAGCQPISAHSALIHNLGSLNLLSLAFQHTAMTL